MKTKLLIATLAGLLLMVAVAGACTQWLTTPEPATIWTPAPVSSAPLAATLPAEILPTLPLPSPTLSSSPTPTSTAQPTTAPTLPPTVTPTREPTPDPHRAVITEEDVRLAIASGGVEQGGLMMEGATVRFVPDKMIFSATRLTYGLIEVRNLELVGRLVADGGRLRLETESITPRGLVTSLIPTLTNQALAQYTSQWYIEEVRTLEGRLELRIR